MKKITKGKVLISLLVCFLPMFMALIFGPAEVFFANTYQFVFIYSNFGGYMAIAAVVCTLIMALILSILPEKLYHICLAVIFGGSLAAYVQVMFMNAGMELLGVNPDGYKVDIPKATLNIIIWIAIIVIFVVFALLKSEVFKKTVTYAAAFLICIQLTAYVSLVVTADEDAYQYPELGLALTGEDQYVVSAKDNIIVFVLDFFCNTWVDKMEAAYPGTIDFLHDFTYYDNMDPVYFGTFPSFPHFITGQEHNMEQATGEWFEEIWTNDMTVDFYNSMKEAGYITNIFTTGSLHLYGKNDASLLAGKANNIADISRDIKVDYKLLFKVMTKLSLFRMAPDFIKKPFCTTAYDYSRVISADSTTIQHENFDFYEKLLEKGLSTDDSSNYYVVQHLMGAHYFTTDAEGHYKQNSTMEETTKGCMTIVEHYIEELKRLGVYDNATIIITSDHGDGAETQVPFFIKESGEAHEEMAVTNAPTTLSEFLPTIAKLAGLDYEKYGETIYDYKEDELRERTIWFRAYDKDYPDVPGYADGGKGSSNVHYGFTYTGDRDDFAESFENGKDKIIPMIDSFY